MLLPVPQAAMDLAHLVLPVVGLLRSNSYEAAKDLPGALWATNLLGVVRAVGAFLPTQPAVLPAQKDLRDNHCHHTCLVALHWMSYCHLTLQTLGACHRTWLRRNRLAQRLQVDQKSDVHRHAITVINPRRRESDVRHHNAITAVQVLQEDELRPSAQVAASCKRLQRREMGQPFHLISVLALRRPLRTSLRQPPRLSQLQR